MESTLACFNRHINNIIYDTEFKLEDKQLLCFSLGKLLGNTFASHDFLCYMFPSVLNGSQVYTLVIELVGKYDVSFAFKYMEKVNSYIKEIFALNDGPTYIADTPKLLYTNITSDMLLKMLTLIKLYL